MITFDHLLLSTWSLSVNAALLSYALGRIVGRPLLQRVLGRRFASLTATMERGGTSLLLASRLIPVVPFALIGYAAGLGLAVYAMLNNRFFSPVVRIQHERGHTPVTSGPNQSGGSKAVAASVTTP